MTPSGSFPASAVPAGNPLEPAPPGTAELQAWGDSHTLVIPRVARKQRVCGVGVPAYCEGDGIIRAGEPYVEWTEFPGGDAGYADAAGHPVRMAECRSCAARYGRDVLFKEAKSA